MIAGGGHDRVHARPGNDFVNAGIGHDTVSGEPDMTSASTPRTNWRANPDQADEED